MGKVGKYFRDRCTRCSQQSVLTVRREETKIQNTKSDEK